MLVILFICFAIIIYVAILVVSSGNPEIEEKKSTQQSYIQAHGITASVDYLFSDGNRVVRYLVDRKQNIVYVSDSSSSFRSIPCSEITGCEIKIDSEVTGGVGRAIAGGIIAGGSGAVVGAVTAKKSITSFSIIIYRKNIQSPMLELNLISRNTKTNTVVFSEAQDFANRVNASIKAIISTEKHQEAVISSNHIQKETSSHRREILAELKMLLDEGLISNDEYVQKKNVLLDRLVQSDYMAETVLHSATTQEQDSGNTNTYSLQILDTGGDIFNAIKAAQKVTTLDLERAKSFVNNLPNYICKDTSYQECKDKEDMFLDIAPNASLEILAQEKSMPHVVGKVCPYCGEENSATALICKLCEADLEPQD